MTAQTPAPPSTPEQQPGPDSYPWEGPVELNYRETVARISDGLRESFNKLGAQAKLNYPDYSEVEKIVKRCAREAREVNCPDIYRDTQRPLIQAMESYEKAVSFLIAGALRRDTPQILKAARLLQEGNSFVNIARTRMWSTIEELNSKHIGNTKIN